MRTNFNGIKLLLEGIYRKESVSLRATDDLTSKSTLDSRSIVIDIVSPPTYIRFKIDVLDMDAIFMPRGRDETENQQEDQCQRQGEPALLREVGDATKALKVSVIS
ncbi:hypothetical protein ACET3Z_025131 [Daucus carota]